MKCDICGKRIWFWRFNSSRSISGAVAHNKCWDEEEVKSEHMPVDVDNQPDNHKGCEKIISKGTLDKYTILCGDANGYLCPKCKQLAKSAPNVENFDGGLTQVAPKGEFKAQSEPSTREQVGKELNKDYEEKF